MRSIMILAAILIVFGTSMAKVADQMTSEKAQAHSVDKAKAMNAFASVQPKTTGNAGLRSVTVSRDSRGHFQTEGRVDGRRLGFMVDTGASVIALNETSAALIGVRPRPSEYTANVSTANGSIKAARTRLAMVDIGGLVVRDVDALVLPDDALSENLLGLSYLSKLRRYEFAGGKLVAGILVDYTRTDADFEVSAVGTTILKAGLTESWSVAGRVGIAMGNALPYVLAGYTQAKAEASYLGTSIGSETLEGWLVGAGAEFRLADNVSVGAEYRFTKFESLSYGGGMLELDPERHQVNAFVKVRLDVFGK